MKHSIDLVARARQAMVDAGFEAQFTPDVIHEVKSLTSNPHPPDAIPGAKDLRSLLWSSVDNSDTRDMVQLEFAEIEADGMLHLLVAVADVDHYVPRGSAIDRFAAQQTTSIYTGVETFLMLPSELSYGLTSLCPDEDRLAMVADLTIDNDGSVKSTDVYRALVRNKAKMDYDSLGDWLDEGAAMPDVVAHSQALQAQVRLQNNEAQRLDALRARSGSLNFETIEATPVMVDGHVASLSVVHPNSARELIENFMIAANTGVIKFLRAKRFPTLERVVREPERWPRIAAIAASLGDDLPAQPDSVSLSKFLARRRRADPDHFPDLSLSIIKLLGPGEYVAIGPDGPTEEHFGLAVQGYAHSTAPNRRYPDIVTQRLLKAAIAGKPAPYTLDELEEIARHCNIAADQARKVERLMGKVAAANLLSDRIGQVFHGIVTGASESGTYARLINPPAEGRIMQGERGLDVGDRVNVRLISTDPYRGFIDFAAVG